MHVNRKHQCVTTTLITWVKDQTKQQERDRLRECEEWMYNENNNNETKHDGMSGDVRVRVRCTLYIERSHTHTPSHSESEKCQRTLALTLENSSS